MGIIKLIFIYLTTIFILFIQIDSLPNVGSLKREVRFTKLDFYSHNKSISTVNSSSIKQYQSSQMLSVFVSFHIPISQVHAKYQVLKCKDFYVDCYNVVSFEVSNLCTKADILYMFLREKNNYSLKCPLFGDFVHKNITYDWNEFGSMFSFPGEKWWERYWKFHLTFYDQNKQPMLSANLDFYFIQFRNRNRQLKN